MLFHHFLDLVLVVLVLHGLEVNVVRPKHNIRVVKELYLERTQNLVCVVKGPLPDQLFRTALRSLEFLQPSWAAYVPHIAVEITDEGCVLVVESTNSLEKIALFDFLDQFLKIDSFQIINQLLVNAL